MDEAGMWPRFHGATLPRLFIHVIETAESQFKCKFKICIFLPGRVKATVYEMFKDILSGYNVETEFWTRVWLYYTTPLRDQIGGSLC